MNSILGLKYNSKEGKLEKVKIEKTDDGGTLKGLQKLVDGYIEIPRLSKLYYENNIDIIVNEEGLYREDFDITAALFDSTTCEVLTILKGPIIFTAYDEKGETLSLREDQIKIIEDNFETVQIINKNNVDEYYTVMVIPQ